MHLKRYLCLLACFCFFENSSSAQTTEELQERVEVKRKELHQIESVVFKKLDAVCVSAVIAAEGDWTELEKRVTDKLRAAGIKILSGTNGFVTYPLLSITGESYSGNGYSPCFHVNIQLVDMAKLKRNGQKSTMVSWYRDSGFTCDKADLKPKIQAFADETIDEFIQVTKEANKKNR